VDFDYVVMPAIILAIGILVVLLSIRRICSLSTTNFRTWRKVFEYVLLSIVALVAAAVVVSSSYNAIAVHQFWATNPPPGAFYIVNGHRMHMNCTGSGSPTIILEAAVGDDALIWGGVQPVLSETTRVCSYDRAGHGWSEALPGPRDADHIAAELHALLLQAKVTGPIVLMGHSIAGLYMREYASRYPEELAGIVFVDVSTPLQDEDPAVKAVDSKTPTRWISMLLLRARYIAGVPRLTGQCSRYMPGFTDRGRMILQAEDLCDFPFHAVAAEMDSFNRSGHETVHTGPYGALPILIFSQDVTTMRLPVSAQQTADLAKAFDQMQEDLKKLSTRSRRIIANRSGHYVQLSRPDLIRTEVPLFIEQIRGTAPQPTNYGSTVTE
jgi:pimeloyl-ACP methyl ester carboxylesterase